VSVGTNAMKTLKITIILFTVWTGSYGQDGSDIRYFKPFGVDSSLVGQYVHFDFFNRSFASQKIDTVTVIIDGKPIRFIEVRKDNGYNNWFSQQHLQSIDKIDRLTVGISKCRLDSITGSSFGVTMYVNFYFAGKKLLSDRSRQIKYWFDKKDITEVLVKSKQP
jgi:hypothetical protein